ncbi:hypothetical protein QBC34DRAFT_392723 [Podospora aff. communis PSN243]|uniref:FAR-17a/AIG1-like protein n=1 Tax=Podospora aff. communis PSN243 TaxID=3040156 RepID=A0AAV9H346_9PEZI|nr:hypothetical protein QBC34DRAFT_392723 [Podospora aff. communis PSN243]
MAGRPFSFGTDRWDPTHRFETSWLISPWALFFCRALFSLYGFFTTVFISIWQCYHSPIGCLDSEERFSYFTVLTFWGLSFYFLASAVHTFTYARSGVPLLDRFPRPLQALHSAFYTTVVTFPFIVTIVYWVMLYSGPWFPRAFDGWSNVSQHLLNSFFALFEIVIPRTDPMPAVHMLWLVIVLALYLAVAFITHARWGFYPYSFLDPGKQGAWLAAYVFGIAIGALIVFGVVYGLVALRKWITETKLGKHGKFSKQSPRRISHDEEMVEVPSETLPAKPAATASA